MLIEELAKELEAQRTENQTLRNDLTKALESLEQANVRVKELEGQAAKDSHNSSKPPSSNGWKRASTQNAEPARKERQKEWRAARSSGENLDDDGGARPCGQTHARAMSPLSTGSVESPTFPNRTGPEV
jgi:hypothetical protein